MSRPDADSPVLRIVATASYPVVLGSGFAVYAALASRGWPVTGASYTAVLIGAVLVTLHELRLPYRTQWRPSASDVGTDVLFMAAVQAALPLLLSFTLVVALAGLLDAGGLSVSGLWPHDIPVAAQVCLMLLAADFPRYWLHRAFHRFAPMWRLHAVHHSPHRLYWLNVGRFHPIEKAVQYTVDALPFVLMGVAPQVLAAYFVFYAINGFFQHSNCEVRLDFSTTSSADRSCIAGTIPNEARSRITTSATISSSGMCCSARGSFHRTGRWGRWACATAHIRRVSLRR